VFYFSPIEQSEIKGIENSNALKVIILKIIFYQEYLLKTRSGKHAFMFLKIALLAYHSTTQINSKDAKQKIRLIKIFL